MDVSRRGFLARLGVAGAATMAGEVPAMPVKGGSVPTIAGPLGNAVKEAAKKTLRSFAEQMHVAGRMFVGTGREFAKDRRDIQEVFGAADTVRDLLSGKISVNDVTLDPSWTRNLNYKNLLDPLASLPGDLTVEDLANPELEAVFREFLGEEGVKSLPDIGVRKQITDVVSRVTGGDKSQTLDSLHEKLYDRTTEVAESIYKRMKSDPAWCPESMRERILEDVVGSIDNTSNLRQEALGELRKVREENGKAFAKEYAEKEEAEERNRQANPSARGELYVQVIDHSKDPSENMTIGPRTFSLTVRNASDYRGGVFRFTPVHIHHFLQTVLGSEVAPNAIDKETVREFPGGVQFSFRDEKACLAFREAVRMRMESDEGNSFLFPDRAGRPILGEKMMR